MKHKTSKYCKIISMLLTLIMLISQIPMISVFASQAKDARIVYLHAQGTNPPLGTVDSSTVYYGDTVDIYMAADNPNKGEYDENGETSIDKHKEPQYDMNGYTVKIYYDPAYFELASSPSSPLDYTVPAEFATIHIENAENAGESNVEAPAEVGYYVHANGLTTKTINSKTYKAAYATIFFGGDFLPQKHANQNWYNIVKLPLKPIKTGATEVWVDVATDDEYTLELFAKNNESDELEDQTFDFSIVNAGYHQIIIKDKLKPAPPIPTVSAGDYTEAKTVALTSSEDGCDIYYKTSENDEYSLYTSPIEIDVTTTIWCYTKRVSDQRQSDVATYKYSILPKAPYLFDTDKNLIPNVYNKLGAFDVYIGDQSIFGTISDENEVYYTFSELPVSEIAQSGTNPDIEWVNVPKGEEYQKISINKNTTIRLVTKKMGEYSDISWYYLGLMPANISATPDSSFIDGESVEVTLSCEFANAEIYYTLDGSDPITNGTLYISPLNLTKDTTVRAVAKCDGIYGNVSSFYYIFNESSDSVVEALYPAGGYEGSVNVTLMPNNPDNEVYYSIDGGNTWQKYTDTLAIEDDTIIFAKTVAPNGDEGDIQTFAYKISPLAPKFAPEDMNFANNDIVTVYCMESDNDNKDRYKIYYTTDGTNPTTSPTRKEASFSANIDISKYTVISAVVQKDGKKYSRVETHYYDVVPQKPAKPMVTLPVGDYCKVLRQKTTFGTDFIDVPAGTKIYYTVGYGDEFLPDPVVGEEGTKEYIKQPENSEPTIDVKDKTTIKAIAVNSLGVKSDVAIFSYTVTHESPVAAPSSVTNGDRLPVVPVEVVEGTTVEYNIASAATTFGMSNASFKNSFFYENDVFYLDTSTGNAYKDRECTQPLGNISGVTISNSAILDILTILDGHTSPVSRYIYTVVDDSAKLAPPYADKKSGEYEEIKLSDSNNNLLSISLNSLNSGDTIEYKLNNSGGWVTYNAPIEIADDTTLQVRSKKGENYSSIVSYTYYFVPLAPNITLPSGIYNSDVDNYTEILYDERIPSDKHYRIYYRANSDTQDYQYTGERLIDRTTSFKAYVKNMDTGRVSKSVINFYILESPSAAVGDVYVANPYDAERISAHMLTKDNYADGIKLLTQNTNADIYYYYSYTKVGDSTLYTTNLQQYDNAAPIMLNSNTDKITIYAHLKDRNGTYIDGSEMVHTIDILRLGIPVTSLGNVAQHPKDTAYTIINNYQNNANMILYYTLDGSDPTDSNNSNRKKYSDEELKLSQNTTVKAVCYSACGTCVSCTEGRIEECRKKVYGEIGKYYYTIPSGGGSGGGSSGGGGGGSRVVDNTRKYTNDIFGNENPTHIGYINGYPDGSVQPDGKITREEMMAILYRIKNKQYDEPFSVKGDVFPDVAESRWSVSDIEYMAKYNVIEGYPDGEFKPSNNLTRAEFAALIRRFTGIKQSDAQNIFPDLTDNQWAYEDIMALYGAGMLSGYEDGTIRPENEITRAEAMKAVNLLLGRNPSEPYVKSLDYNPFNDLETDKWYYVIVLEATITHTYYLDDKGVEIKWEDCK